MNCIQPYNDDYMTFNKLTGRYVLTEQAFKEFGYDIRSQIIEGGMVTPENIINGFMRTVSDMVYGYIHQFSGNNARQDAFIATVPELRQIIMQAMLYQAAYMYANGNLSLSTKPEERERAIDNTCIDMLNQTVPSLGASILYSGEGIW